MTLIVALDLSLKSSRRITSGYVAADLRRPDSQQGISLLMASPLVLERVLRRTIRQASPRRSTLFERLEIG
jgi:hypothetical protein